MKYSILLGLLLASFSISAQVISTDTLAYDTTKVKKKTILNRTTTAQTTTTQTNFTPNVIPPSPNAASLGKYGDIPVSYYTGLVNTSIPIYTISDQDIQIPISLSYHHGGIRVEEEASVVGLGWSLNAGGVITRTIRGRDDFHEQYGAAFNLLYHEIA